MRKLYSGIPFSPQASLTGNIGAADTVIKVSDVSVFPEAPNYATIGTDEQGETIIYTAKTADALSGCQRGVEGTARAWGAGELIARNFTAADHRDLIENIGTAQTAAAAVSERVDTIENDVLPAKQDALTGLPGQVVGFNADGAAEAQDAPAMDNAVTVPAGATLEMGASLGEGPYTFEVEEDGEGSAVSAAQVSYDGTGSGLAAETVQGALDALNAQKADASRTYNPNLLDNWYFADPIDQRNGHIVNSGVTYYSDAGLTTSAGTTSAAMTAKYVNATYGTVTVSGITYYVAAADVVRGYTAMGGYAIDRWIASLPTGAFVKIEEDGILLHNHTSSYAYLYQKTERKKTRSETFSVLDADENLYTLSALQTSNGSMNTSFGGIKIETANNAQATIAVYPGHSVKLIAAKLELGTVQTLAHKDENGSWVLNDPPPNKALEMAKCQRYQVVWAGTYDPVGFGQALSNTSALIQVPLPVSLRAKPTVSGNLNLRNKTGFSNVTSIICELASPNIATLILSSNAVIEGSPYECFISSAGKPLIFDANL